MQNLKLDDIADRIAFAILEERFLNKKSIIDRIRPILKIWLKRADSVKSSKTKPASVHKLQWTVAREKVNTKFWLNVLRKEIGEENVKPYYDKQTQHMIDEGCNTYEEPNTKLV